MAKLLYDYFRSSAAYRVRIALNIKKVDTERISINLKPGVDEQHGNSYRKLNPQGRVPYYCDGDFHLGQSTAILEYLEEHHPEPPLLPSKAEDKARVRQLSSIIACDVHPLNNLSVTNYLKNAFSADSVAINQWYSHWISEGFAAFEEIVKSASTGGKFCFGDSPSMADLYLVPQLYNARRFNVKLDRFQKILAIEAECQKLDAFYDARPEAQPDADV